MRVGVEEEMEFNGSAKNIVFALISDNLFHQVASCLTAKEIWDKLKTTHKGTQQQKDNQDTRVMIITNS